jgi:hypothetical protein
VPAPDRSSSRRRYPTCSTGSAAASPGWAAFVWDREGALHAGGGHPTGPFAAFCGELGVGWRFLEARDPQSKGVVERLQGYLETSFEPGRSFAYELDFQEQLDRSFDERANLRFHRILRCRPADRLAEELQVMRPPPERMPDVDRRFVTRVPPDPYIRVDTCDYSLDPRLVGGRVELRVSQREVLAIRACLAGSRVAFATATEWVACLGDAQRQGRLDEELRKLLWTPLLVVDEVGYSPSTPKPPTSCFRSSPLATSAPR